MGTIPGFSWWKGSSWQGHGKKRVSFRVSVPSRRGDIIRVLKGAVTLEDALIKAVEACSTFARWRRQQCHPWGTLLSSCVSGWIYSLQLRYDSGELSASALQNKKGLFAAHVSRFIRFICWTYVSDISVDG